MAIVPHPPDQRGCKDYTQRAFPPCEGFHDCSSRPSVGGRRNILICPLACTCQALGSEVTDRRVYLSKSAHHSEGARNPATSENDPRHANETGKTATSRRARLSVPLSI